MSIKNRGTLVVGPRGTGKTAFLLDKARQGKLLCLSADSPLVSNTGLWGLVRLAFQRDFDGWTEITLIGPQGLVTFPMEGG